MIWVSQKYFLYLVVIIALIGITCSHENDTRTDRRRHGRVNGRIVKLYSGPKPDPILCMNEGFLADAVDCSVFYRCLKASNGKYTVYRFQCGPGTVYDPDTEICNHPRSTKRSHCGGINRDKHFSSTEKYNKNEIDGFEKENEELPLPISTRLPIVNNSALDTVATTSKKLDSFYTTINYPWFTTPEHIKNEKASTWGVPAPMSSVKPWENIPTTYVTPQPTKQRGVICTSDGFMGDREDCRKFYRCVNNQRGGYLKYEFSCSESTIWDDDTQGCNHPWAVQRRRCGKGNSYIENSIKDVDQIQIDEEATNHVFQQQTQISYGSKITQIQTQINKGPAVQNQTQISFGDRINQEKLQTNYGAEIGQSQNQVNYGSEVTQIHLQDKYSNDIVQAQTPLISTTIATSTKKIKYSISSKCTKVGFMGDSIDCKKFYRCISNERGGFIANEFSCSEGTLWDEHLEACNHAWAVKCGEKKSSKNLPSPTATEKTTKDYTTTSSSFYSNDINEIGYMSENIQQDLDWPKSSTKTTLKTTTTTEPSKLYETDCKASGFFGYAYDCQKFYKCVEDANGRYKKYDYKCGDGTVWDSMIESCNHAWAVKSCSTHSAQKEMHAEMSSTDNKIITTVSLIQTTTQSNIYDEDHLSGYDTFHKETSLQSTTVTENIFNQGNECKEAGFMGDNKDCTIFYRCVENGSGGYKRHEFTCGKGTVWDAEIEACNHAWAVEKCGGNGMKLSETTSLQKPSVSKHNSSNDGSYNINQEYDKEADNIINQEYNKEADNIRTTTSSPNTSSVTPVNDNGNGCHRNGFMGHDTDCKIFYRCVDNGNGGFIRYEFSCGDGTVWDPNIAACNHVWAVEKCGGRQSTNHPNHVTSSVTDKTSTQDTTLSSSTMLTTSTTIVTTTISNKNNECNGNGFIGDNQDCKKFYRCVEDGKGSYLRYEFACGEGTLWDPKIEACNHAWAVTSCGFKESPDSDSMSTQHPMTIKDEQINNNTNGVTENNQEISISTESNSWSSTVKPSTVVDDVRQCKADGFMGDAMDCRKFYRCVNDGKGKFIRYEFTCSEGTIWDSEKNACNHMNSVKTPCSAYVDTQTTKENEPSYTVTSLPSNSNDNVNSSEAPSRTQNCEQEGFFGDKTNCKKFYRCTDNGQGGFHKYEFTCGEGTIWDQEILACNHASSTSHCDSSVIEPQTEHPGSHSTLPSSTLQPTDKPETSPSSDACNSEGFYANSNDCQKFYRCVQDGKGGYIKYDFTCGESTVWVQDIQACDHDNVPSSCSKSTTTTTTTTTSNAQTSEEKPVTISSTTAASVIDSSTSTPNTKSTLQDETVSASSSTTETSSSTSTSTSAGNQDHCTESGYFGDSKDCKMFYRCVDNGKDGYTKYDFTCGDGTIWDQDIIACNHPKDVSNPSCDNKDSSSTATTTTTAKTTHSTAALESTKTTSSTETTTAESSNQEVSTNKPSNNNYTCTEAGFYADPHDCKKFYRCVDWGNDGKTFSIYHFDCGDGTIWDPELKTCNHEDSVYPPRDCSGKQSQNENGTTTTPKDHETTESSAPDISTTTSQSTTQTSTTSGSTATTKLSSTTDQTSTQQSSSSEQTSSTQQSSTQMSTTEENTTQQSTVKPSTTQKSTTEQSTTQQSTTEQTTTEQSTTISEQTTTQQTSTTEESGQNVTTTEQSTTTTTESSTSTTTEQSNTTTTENTTTEKTTASSTEETTTTAQTSTTESTTGTTDQATKPEQTTTQESSTEQSSENQSSTTEQSTTQETSDGSSTTESGQETSTEQDSSDKKCPQTDNDQYLFVCPTGFRRHQKYCNMFYQCTEDDDSHEMKVAVFNCPNNTIYDESKTQCVEEEKADKKCDGQIAERRRVKRLDKNYKETITVGKQKYLCPSLGHFPFETTEECSPVFFKCELSKSGKLRGLVYQCPEGYVYWSISRRCEPIGIMIDCKRSLINWNGRYEIPTERNNVARKNMK